MTKQQYDQLCRIYNTLRMVSTRGDDTIIMGDCLTTLNKFLNEIKGDIKDG